MPPFPSPLAARRRRRRESGPAVSMSGCMSARKRWWGLLCAANQLAQLAHLCDCARLLVSSQQGARRAHRGQRRHRLTKRGFHSQQARQRRRRTCAAGRGVGPGAACLPPLPCRSRWPGTAPTCPRNPTHAPPLAQRSQSLRWWQPPPTAPRWSSPRRPPPSRATPTRQANGRRGPGPGPLVSGSREAVRHAPPPAAHARAGRAFRRRSS